MSALTVDSAAADGRDWDDLVRIWEETDAPECCKVEIIEGIITVSPPPSPLRNDIADEVQRALYGVIPRDWGVHQTQAVTLPTRAGMFIPDLLVAPKGAVREAPLAIPASDAELVVEITSRNNANHDRIVKLQAYATAAVPSTCSSTAGTPAAPPRPSTASRRTACTGSSTRSSSAGNSTVPPPST